MKAILICPAERPAVPLLATASPLVLAPLLGQCVLELWLEDLASHGVGRVTVLAADRPAEIRRFTGQGERWGLQVEVLPQVREPEKEEAARRHAGRVVVLDHLPDDPAGLFESYSAWHAALLRRLPSAAGPARIGLRELAPGIWAGWRSRIDPTARMEAPCWIGSLAHVGSGAVIGPGSVVEDRAVIEPGARLEGCMVGPDTYVGAQSRLEHVLALGPVVVDLASGAARRVTDRLHLCSLEPTAGPDAGSPWAARTTAGAILALTAPIAALAIALAHGRGETPWVRRRGVRPQPPGSAEPFGTFTYHELAASRGWLRRWPQFWSIVRGDLRWFGNRPLRPSEVPALGSEFERLWVATPPGLLSLADAHGCPEGTHPAGCGHAGFYSVQRSLRLHLVILTRCLVRAMRLWPFQVRPRRQDAAAALPQLEPEP